MTPAGANLSLVHTAASASVDHLLRASTLAPDLEGNDDVLYGDQISVMTPSVMALVKKPCIKCCGLCTSTTNNHIYYTVFQPPTEEQPSDPEADSAEFRVLVEFIIFTKKAHDPIVLLA